MRVLIVEDDITLGDAVRDGLHFEGFTVDLVRDGGTALESLSVNDYDAVVLDRDLPGVHGDDICRRLATEDDSPAVLMLTAAGLLHEKVAGFQLGADDYLAKPFEFPELIVRLRALGRRRSTHPPVLEQHGVALDPFRRTVSRDGIAVRLTRKEIAVLEVLMRADGGVVSAETLLEKAWDENANPFTNTMRVAISSLRRKLGEPWVIQTVPGFGYVMRAPR